MAIRASARCDATCAAGFPPTVWVDAPVEARSTVDALTIEAHRGVSIRGSLRFDGPDAPGDDVRNLMFSLVRADGRGGMVPTVGVSAGEFASVELAAGEYLIRPGPFGTPAGWTIKSAMVDGRDITDEPLVIGDGSPPPGRVTVTVGPSNPANLSGTVRTPAAQPDAAATVLVFPADRKYGSHNLAGTSMGRTRMAMSSRLGAYLLRDVRPGDYLVAAVPDTAESFSALFSPDPALFERLAPHATHVTVEEGVDTVQDVRTVR
jgi:hypothetical protein